MWTRRASSRCAWCVLKGVPILNGLELRLLPAGSYPTREQARRPGQDILVNLARVTCDPGTLTANTSYRCVGRGDFQGAQGAPDACKQAS